MLKFLLIALALAAEMEPPENSEAQRDPDEYDVTIVNNYDFEVSIWWQDSSPQTQEEDIIEFHPQFSLPSKETRSFGTFEGHIFHVLPADGDQEKLLNRFVTVRDVLEYVAEEKAHADVTFTNDHDSTLQIWYHDGVEAHPIAELQPGEKFEDQSMPDSIYVATNADDNEIVWKAMIQSGKTDYKIEL